MILLLSLFLYVGPVTNVQHCDVIELNHVHNREGSVTFQQIIYWRWESDDRLHVCAWRVVTGDYVVRNLSGSYTDMWSKGGILYKVRGKSFRRTRTMYDPEILDRQQWAVERRVWSFPAR